MPSPPGTEADPFFDAEFSAPEAAHADPDDTSRLDVPGLELRRFLREQLRALNPPLSVRPPRVTKPSRRTRTRRAIMRGEK